MHVMKQSCNSLLIALAISAMPAIAQNIEISESEAVGQPKYAQRIKDLGEQIQLVQSKGLITEGDASKFLERKSQLAAQFDQTKKDGFKQSAANDLEKAITLLNADVFKASHKSNPVKPGQADKEVNDPNLIPAYPDAKLQPGSGVVDKK